MKSFLYSRLKSFRYAITGLTSLIRSEQNMWIHLAATIAVILAGIAKNIDNKCWCLIFVAIGLVWISEAINTAIEKLCDVVSKEYHPAIKQVKNVSAATVLVAAIIAVAIAIIVFLA